MHQWVDLEMLEEESTFYLHYLRKVIARTVDVWTPSESDAPNATTPLNLLQARRRLDLGRVDAELARRAVGGGSPRGEPPDAA